MAKFLLRRLANYVILVAVATSAAYMLASVSLKPRANFEGRNPPPPPAAVDARLTQLNLNDKTPVLERYKNWVSDLAHGDFGKTWVGESVNAVGSMVFESSGEFTPGLQGGFWTHAVDRVQHLILPSITLVLGEIAIFSRYQRSAMLDVLGQDFVRTAQAKGLRRRTALLRHALRTALIPAVTYFAYNFGLLLVGATFVEKIFGWHGMGEWFVDSVTSNDVNAVAAVSCFTAVLVLIAGLLSDLGYAVLDPRIRVS